jgi:hypothetical protein
MSDVLRMLLKNPVYNRNKPTGDGAPSPFRRIPTSFPSIHRSKKKPAGPPEGMSAPVVEGIPPVWQEPKKPEFRNTT